MTEIEVKTILERDLNCLKQNKSLPDSIEAMEVAIKALEKQAKIKESFEKWETDTGGFYGADDETTHLIGTLKKILRSDEEWVI